MRFWDSSAIVPLCIEQPSTPVADRLYAEDSALAVWWPAPVECASAFARLRRGHLLDGDAETAARVNLDRLQSLWIEIQPTAGLRDEALRALDAHALTAADALQLAAALEWVGGDPAGASLVTFDRRLGDAARREGFEVPDAGGFER